MKTFKWTVPEPAHRFTEKQCLQIPEVRGRIRSPLWMASASLFIVAFILLLGKSSGGGAFIFLPYAFGPMVVSLLLGAAAASRLSLAVLLLSNVLYFGWFLWVYVNAFHLHPDPQAGIAFIFVGLQSLPVMIPLWMVALFLRNHKAIESKLGAP